MKSLFIFRRDYRLTDNKGLIEACKNSNEILCVFIFTPEQTKTNEFFADASFQFLIESLKELDEEIKKKLESKLYIIYDNNVKALKQIKKNFDYDAIYFNEDYTPYAKKRDEEIDIYCKKENIELIKVEDYLLAPMGTFLKKDNTYYGVYGAFRKITKGYKVNKIDNYKFNKSKFIKIDSPKNLEDFDTFYVKNDKLLIKGGRSLALNVLKNIDAFSTYETHRDILDYNTTHLSPILNLDV